MFWQRLGWPESKPAVKKFWTIRTKIDGKILGFLFRPKSSLIAVCQIIETAIHSLRAARTCSCLPWNWWSSPNLVRIAQFSLLLALIPANPDVVKTFFSLIYYYTTSRFFVYILCKNGLLGLSTIMRNLIVLYLDLRLAYLKICLKILSGWPRFVCSHCNYEIKYWQVKIESNILEKKKREKNEQTNLIMCPWAGHELTSLSVQLTSQVCLLLNTLVTPQRKTY